VGGKRSSHEAAEMPPLQIVTVTLIRIGQETRCTTNRSLSGRLPTKTGMEVFFFSCIREKNEGTKEENGDNNVLHEPSPIRQQKSADSAGSFSSCKPDIDRENRNSALCFELRKFLRHK